MYLAAKLVSKDDDLMNTDAKKAQQLLAGLLSLK